VETVWNEGNFYEPGVVVTTGNGAESLQTELAKFIKNPLVVLGGLALAADAGWLGGVAGDGEAVYDDDGDQVE